MRTDKLIDQLELYSNAVVGFMVAQSIGFSVTFGTNADFGCVITQHKLLALALVAHFVLTSALSATGLAYLHRQLARLSSDNVEVLRTLYGAKAVVVLVFALIPTGVLLAFGVFADRSQGRCAQGSALSPSVVSVADGQERLRLSKSIGTDPVLAR
jgi:hypothetical protein